MTERKCLVSRLHTAKDLIVSAHGLIYWREMDNFIRMNYKGEVPSNQDKANCISCKSYHSDMDLVCVAQRGRAYRNEPQKLEQSQVKGKTNSLTTVAKDNLIMQCPRGNNHGGTFVEKSPTITGSSWQHNNYIVDMKDNIRQMNVCVESNREKPYQQGLVYDVEAQAPALMNGHGEMTSNIAEGFRIRRLTPTECARLQTIPDWYKWGVSETQQYKLLGNGWTVEVIKHILSYLPGEIKFK